MASCKFLCRPGVMMAWSFLSTCKSKSINTSFDFFAEAYTPFIWSTVLSYSVLTLDGQGLTSPHFTRHDGP